MKINAGDSDLRKGVSIIGSMIIKAVKDECNVCCIIIPNPMRTQYKKIKHVALVEQKVVCQIVNENTLRKKGLQSIATKILLQIIAKRGNTLWVPKTNSVYADTIICAFEQAKVLEGKYNLSLCATINSTFSSIFSTSNIYEGSENKFQCMSVLLQKAVDSYLKRNKEPPK